MHALAWEEPVSSEQVDEPIAAVQGLVVLGVEDAETCSDEMCSVSIGDIGAN